MNSDSHGAWQDKPEEASEAPTDEELGPMTHIDVPNTFQGWCALVRVVPSNPVRACAVCSLMLCDPLSIVFAL